MGREDIYMEDREERFSASSRGEQKLFKKTPFVLNILILI
jgi:hypothetical protein